MKFLAFIFLICFGFYMNSFKAEADSKYTIYLKDKNCTSTYAAKDGGIDQYSSVKSNAKCIIDESKKEMKCRFTSQDDGSLQGTDLFKFKKTKTGDFELVSNYTYTLMTLNIRRSKYSYHLNGYRKFQHKLVTQICSGKIH